MNAARSLRAVSLAALILTTGLSFAQAAEGDGELFSISVDGEQVAGTPRKEAGEESGSADVQVKYDGLGVAPILNVATANARRSFAVGEEVPFLASSNYPAFIARKEIRIFATGRHAPAAPVAVVKVESSGRATWAMPPSSETAGLDDFAYVLRVYDGQGRFDETRPLTLARRSALAVAPEAEPGAAPGYSDDNTAFRNIRVEGGAITVAGRDIPESARVSVLGEAIPVDAEGRFVVQRILPPGDHEVDVALSGGKQGAVTFNRDVNIPSSEWFYVGLADLTLGSNSGSKNIEAVKPGEYDGVYTKGRAAFYLKGKIKGSYLLTAAADTREDSVENMFTGLDEKDPRSLLNRIDPNDYYAVYGDDSVGIEDAPTSGKFYVRLERGDSRVLWGNFKTDIRGTEFLRNDRGLYGANLVLKSDRMVASGERAGELHGYAAQPGTLPQRDVLRGTGGSAYFLTRRDITVGSETLYIEVRNPVTGSLIDRQQLRYGHDYTIDYLQGVVLLDKPLSSSASDGAVVHDGALGGNDQYLVAAYEFTPAVGDVDGYVYGGRAQQWLGDHVRLGATGAMEKTGAADQTLVGADVQLYKSERTFIEGEVAQSEGPGFGFSESINGGLTVTDTAPVGAGQRAMAYRVLGRVGLGDVVPGTKGDLQFSYAYKEKGFATLDQQVDENRMELGLKGDLALSDRLSLDFYGDQLDTGDTLNRRGGAGLTYELTEQLFLSAGAEHVSVNEPSQNLDGQRTDAALKLERVISEDASVYAFGQVTLERSGGIDANNRAGVGGSHALTDTIDASGEVSYGTNGVGGRALLSYEPVAADRYYIGYALDPDSWADKDFLSGGSTTDLGGIIAGVKHGFSERLSVYAETKYDLWDIEPSLTQVYGVTYTPSPVWKLGGAVESGIVWGDSADDGFQQGDFHRTAVSLTASYSPDEKMNATVKGEVRFDDADEGSGDLTAYYFAGRFNRAINPDWRLVATADAVISDGSESTRDGDYVEASIGYAYRPVTNDRLNALVRYTFLYDLPGPDQVTSYGSTSGPSQRSNIFSADASYDVTPMLTLGGKYGVRYGEIKPRSGEGGWQSSSAQIAILRADFHVVKNWDVLIEGRSLWENTAGSAQLGALAAVYRQISDNFEIGVGYNFGRYSDDLADLSADDQGFFINAVGKL